MKLEISTSKHLKELVSLINLAYRGDHGWTKETEIVEGKRVTQSGIRQVIEDPNSHFLSYVKDNSLISCICLTVQKEVVFISLFAVSPQWQNKGLGKQILMAAEEYAASIFGAKKFVMIVVSQRPELISYYERRGYIRTGETEEYPVHLGVGIPKMNGLTIEYLEKKANPLDYC